MPYRQLDDGSCVAVRTTNRPARSLGSGSWPRPRRSVGGMGASSSLSRGDAVALAVGARVGDRAAGYALQVVRARGLGEWAQDASTGEWVDAPGSSDFLSPRAQGFLSAAPDPEVARAAVERVEKMAGDLWGASQAAAGYARHKARRKKWDWFEGGAPWWAYFPGGVHAYAAGAR